MPRRFTTLLLGACLLCAPALAQRSAHPLFFSPSAETPIQLQQAGIAVDIGGGMAATTLDFTVYNPNARVLEGELQLPLAPGQRVNGFALDFNGEMRPAVPVEKAKGRQVFEAIVRRGVDPALLEATEGDNFKLRVYPIPPHGTRHVRLQLVQALDRAGGRWTYRLPLPYAAGAGDIDGVLKVHGAAKAPQLLDAMTPVDFQPVADGFQASLPRRVLAGGALTVSGAVDQAARAYTGELGDESYFYAEIPVTAPTAQRPLPKVVGLLWDSSGSGATRRHEQEFALLERYFRAAGDVEVRLTRLRDRAEPVRSYRVRGGDWRELRHALETTVYDGATALGGWTPERQAGEYLLVSDGLENYGARSFPNLLPAQRLYVLNAAPGADSARLDALAQRFNGRLINLGGSIDDDARALLNDGPRITALDGDGLADLQAEAREPRGGVLHVAGRRLRPDAVLHVTIGAQTIDVPVTANSPRQPLAPMLWAGWRIDALQADYLLKRAEIARLGKRFGIVTRDTSLIVLESLNDYVRYGITPPPAMRRAFDQMQTLRFGQLASTREAHLQRILRELDAKQAWWETRYPKGQPGSSYAEPGDKQLPPRALVIPAPVADARSMQESSTAKPGPMLLPAPSAQPVLQSDYAPNQTAFRRSASAPSTNVTVSGSRVAASLAPAAGQPAGIALQKWAPDAHYLDRMRQATAEQAYAIYLDQKPDFANATGFYLDVADLLFDKGNRELALRVLSNLAEMDLENRQVLRVLGYRLLQAGAPELAVPVFEQVLRLADDEPQSWRDLGLAYAAVGRPQEALDTLREVVLRDWDTRFADVELITLADIDALVAANKGKLDVRAIDPRLLRHLPLDLRVVLTWDADNSDMDLWVTDPNGERCMYSNRLTYQGGHMSRDVTGGYGPEEFSLREAKPGKYKVEANFYGHRQQLLASSTTLQLKLTTGFGTPRAREQMVTMRLRGQGETVFVGEFEVPAP